MQKSFFTKRLDEINTFKQYTDKSKIISASSANKQAKISSNLESNRSSIISSGSVPPAPTSKAQLPMKKAKFKNDPKLTAKIRFDEPIFHRDVRAEDIHEGH